MRQLFTSESVSEGHPDKVCDQISDAILDAHLRLDPGAHVACETLVTTNFCVLAGEVKANGKVDYEAVARETIKDIGYTLPEIGFHFQQNEYINRIHSQSQDIDHGVVSNQAPVTRVSCSATPATKQRPSCPIPYTFHIASSRS